MTTVFVSIKNVTYRRKKKCKKKKGKKECETEYLWLHIITCVCVSIQNIRPTHTFLMVWQHAHVYILYVY